MRLAAFPALAFAATLALGCAPTSPQTVATVSEKQLAMIDLSALEPVATVDERFLSYNVEMVEVTGGRFWAPYENRNGERYRMRPPMDLSSQRLRNLAKQLGPAYVRVSGTWANSTYLQVEGEQIDAPPSGFEQLLTRDQWRGLVDFVEAVDGAIVTSFPISTGARDEGGVWQTEQAQRILDLTRESGGTIAAAEFANEPNATALGRFPAGYSAQDYGRDFRIVRDWARANAPEMKIVGSGSVGEGAIFGSIPVAAQAGFIRSQDMLGENPGSVDVFSYHFYGAVSERCAGLGVDVAEFDAALSAPWLERSLSDLAFYSELRDRFEPGKPIWLTETAQAACGGSPWAASFADSFRYVDQLGQHASGGVEVVMHNTLAASDYALIDEDTLEPRPNYWAALLWKRVMGETVLSRPAAPSPDLRIYAHCSPTRQGGVGLAILNLGGDAHRLPLGAAASVFSLTAAELDSPTVMVNGVVPAMDEAGAITGLNPVETASATIPPQSITFVSVPAIGNASCS